MFVSTKGEKHAMKVIGITGGIGGGKSAILAHIAAAYRCKVILADEVAHTVKEPGRPCFGQLIALLGAEILDVDGLIDKGKMAGRIFADEGLRRQVNEIIHPAVKADILAAIATERAKGEADFLFIEAALLIEDGYEQVVDELWYIYADLPVRRERLQRKRNYPPEKIDAIVSRQLSEENFRARCKVIIVNNGTLEEAYKQVDEKLGEYLWRKEENIPEK